MPCTFACEFLGKSRIPSFVEFCVSKKINSYYFSVGLAFFGLAFLVWFGSFGFFWFGFFGLVWLFRLGLVWVGFG